jgi:hypothetical protein
MEHKIEIGGSWVLFLVCSVFLILHDKRALRAKPYQKPKVSDGDKK